MADYVAEDFKSLHQVLCVYRKDKNWIFRGHADAAWQLIPRAGRGPYNGVSDRSYFEAWKRRAIEYVKNLPDSDWEWLAIAQHHGLATRLLDWTTNPLVAAYFAAREPRDSDGVIYAVRFKKFADREKDPMQFTGVAEFLPQGVVPRITRQGGRFSIHGDPAKPLDVERPHLRGLERIIIPCKHRSALLAELSYYGVNDATVFPDLDGLSKFTNWLVESKEYFRR